MNKNDEHIYINKQSNVNELSVSNLENIQSKYVDNVLLYMPMNASNNHIYTPELTKISKNYNENTPGIIMNVPMEQDKSIIYKYHINRIEINETIDTSKYIPNLLNYLPMNNTDSNLYNMNNIIFSYRYLCLLKIIYFKLIFSFLQFSFNFI